MHENGMHENGINGNCIHENGMYGETTSKDRVILRKQFAKNKYKEEYIYQTFLYLFTFLFNLPKTFFFNSNLTDYTNWYSISYKKHIAST